MLTPLARFTHRLPHATTPVLARGARRTAPRSTILFGASALVALAAAAAAQAPTFATPVVNYFTGDCPAISGQGFPISVATGDFNGDSMTDLAVANYGCGSVAILLGNGDGTFGAPTQFAVQRDGAQGIAVGDFNGDGKADVAACNSIGHSVSILLGVGDGTLLPAVHFAAPFTPVALIARDLDADGFVDLAVVTNGTNSLTVLKGNGNGSFQLPVGNAVGDYPVAVAAGDFDGNGVPDLVVANFNDDTALGSVSLLLGTGTGTFQAAVSFATGLHTTSVDVGDFNGDGKLDVAAANKSSNDVSVLLGNGNGTLQAAVAYPAGSQPLWVTVADLNGDGHPDLAVSDQDRSVSILQGHSDGTFTPVANLAQAGAFADPIAITNADFNGDGRRDLVTVNLIGDNVSVLLNTSDRVPTAVAGPDQSIHTGSVVSLDGQGSFDDNTPSANLQFQWTIVAAPPGSTAMLGTPNAPTAAFVADLPGTYVVSLVVINSLGQASQPSSVVIASYNLAPTANAGNDRVALLGSSVALDGSASADPDADALLFQWVFASKPAGSNAVLVGANTANPSFTADRAGTYEVSLVVSDFLGPSPADVVLVVAITGLQAAENAVMAALQDLNALPPSAFTNRGNRRELTRLLAQTLQSLERGRRARARAQLRDAIERTDGCALRGHRDAGGPGRDWIVTCPAQASFYANLTAALAAITP